MPNNIQNLINRILLSKSSDELEKIGNHLNDLINLGFNEYIDLYVLILKNAHTNEKTFSQAFSWAYCYHKEIKIAHDALKIANIRKDKLRKPTSRYSILENRSLIKIGFLSHKFCAGLSSPTLFNPWLCTFPRNSIQVFFISDKNYSDDPVQNKLKKSDGVWVDISNFNDGLAQERITDLNLDVLVVIHATRPTLIKNRLAKTQIDWFGACHDLASIDYTLGTTGLFPNSEKELIGGKFCLLNDYFHFPFQKPPDLPIEIKEQGNITFGAFNRFSKVTDETLNAWVTILNQVQGSKLYIRFLQANNHIFGSLQKKMLQCGVDLNRIMFGKRLAFEDHLMEHNKIDIMLDSFPQSGGVTYFESTWMGVPMITMAQDNRLGSRNGVEIANYLGLNNLIASDLKEYIDLAVNLAKDFKKIKSYKLELRNKILNSNLIDPTEYAKKIWPLLSACATEVARSGENRRNIILDKDNITFN